MIRHPVDESEEQVHTMHELRQNVATREWVIIATERSERPREHVGSPREGTGERPEWVAECPFCPGNEDPELEVMRLPGTGEWQTRVLRNKYPALKQEGQRERTVEGIHRRTSAVGYHEVLVEFRHHNASLALGTPEDAARVLRVFHGRGRAMAQDSRVEHIIYFENHGRGAGATLTHPHAQLAALPVVPHNIRVRSAEARRYFDNTGECVYCRMRAEAVGEGSRLVVESDRFVAFVPYAASSPYHVWIVPRRHGSSFRDATPAELEDLGYVLRRVLRKLHMGLGDPDYNYIIRSAPIKDVGQEYLHWYAAVLPRVSRTTGFELGTGIFVNTSLPARSAAFLRSVDDGE